MKKLILVSFMALMSSMALSQSKDVVDIAASSADHTTLVTTVKAAGLESVLKGEGPFTVFAPTNASFEKLPAATIEDLLKPENKDKLSKILTYHILKGAMDSKSIMTAIEAGSGKATFATINGGKLVFSADAEKVKITDAAGNIATINTVDLQGSNGILHVIDTVLLPN